MYSNTKEFFKKFVTDETFSHIVDIKHVGELLNHIDSFKTSNAVVKIDGSVASYGELKEDILRVCASLKKIGLSKGDHVGLICRNDYNFVASSLGIMAYGCVAVMLPSQLDEQTIFGCSMKFEMKAFLFESFFEEKMGFLMGHNPIQVMKIEEALKSVVLGNIGQLSENDPACILMTGGTTGKSKGVLLSHTALMAGMINGAYGVNDFICNRYYCMLPLTHVFGYIRNLLFSLYSGSTIKFNLDKRLMFDEMREFKPTILVIVPALAELFLNLIKAYGPGMLGGCLKTIICGAANVSPYLVTEYQKLGINFCPGYGLTEFANMVSGNPEGVSHPDSVGYLFPDQEAKIVDGELLLKGRNMMIEYYAEPEENASAFVDGWFRTGDLARFDEDGRLYIIGRIKDVIVLSNGENVSPAHIESKICEIDIIQDALVTESLTTAGAECLKLEVTIRPSVAKALNLTKDSLEKYVKDEINKVNDKLFDYERVSIIEIRDKDFERSPAMKIIRPKKMF